MFAAGVWAFSKGGVEGWGEVDLFFSIYIEKREKNILLINLTHSMRDSTKRNKEEEPGEAVY